MCLLRQKKQSRSSPQRPLVGIAVDGVTGYGRSVMRGVMRYANAQRRWLIHDQVRGTFDWADSWPMCDGAIVAGVGNKLFERIRRNSRHIVVCSGAADPEISPVVCLHDIEAGAMAAEHLIECRLRSFGYYGNRESILSRNRELGFINALTRRGMPCVTCPVDSPAGTRRDFADRPHWPELMKWLIELPKPIGILAADDGTAHDLAAACLKANIPVPEQIAIIGVNNDDLLCDSSWPPLSSVDADFTRIGFKAAQILDQLLTDKKLSPDNRMVRLPPLGVVKRQSTDILAVDDPDVADAVRYIREHACDPCSVEDVLREVPVARRWLERQFMRKLGRTPNHEILRVRIDTAKSLIQQPTLSLSDIALRCGFSSGPTFGRAFVRMTNTTPAAYRRACLRG